MARIIAISNLKGGSGKTTSAVNIAAALALQGKTVLMLDTDPQAHATFCFGASLQKGQKDLASVLMEGTPAAETLLPTSSPGVTLIPASRRLVYFEKQQAANREARTYLASVLRQVEGSFDYVIIDTPPTLGLLTVCALVAARELVIPMQAHVLAMRGLLEMVQLVYKIRRHYNPRLELRAVVPTFYNAHARLSTTIVAEIRKHLGDAVLLPPVRTNIALAEAPRYGKSIFQYSRQSSGAVEYLRVAHAIEKMGPPLTTGEPVAAAKPDEHKSHVMPAQSASVSLPGDGPVLTIPGRDEEEGAPRI